MNKAIWALVAVLIVLHHDFWFWEDSRLAFGFLPVGMTYHIGVSLAAALVWFLAVRYAWPVPEKLESDKP